jgi:prophage antirepressor-like protein
MNNTSVSYLPFGDKNARYHIDNDSQIWFVGKDVCNALGIVWEKEKSLESIKDAWKMRREIPDSQGRNQFTIMISEQAVYKLAFRSRKPEAERFTDAVAEVVATIRKQGYYANQDLTLPSPERRGNNTVAELQKPRHNRLTPERILDIMSDVCLIRDNALRTRIAGKLMNAGGAR